MDSKARMNRINISHPPSPFYESDCSSNKERHKNKWENIVYDECPYSLALVHLKTSSKFPFPKYQCRVII